MNERHNKNTSVYVIDEKFRIVYSNDDLNCGRTGTDEKPYCYQVFCHEDGQCRKCPLREENGGKSILFNKLHKEWVSVTVSPIDWPGAGKCHIIMSDSVEDNGKNFFYSAVGDSDYNELLELNYREDAYNIVYHAEKMNLGVNSQGRISGMVLKIAERLIHPEDRKRFCDFWLLDQIGNEGIPKELLTVRHGEFRKQGADGSYSLVQQVLMPARQSSQDDIFIMSFYNVIDAANELTKQISPVLADISEEGLPNKQTFFKNAEDLMKTWADDTQWCMVAIDIENFKLFNEWYGREVGNEVLADIAAYLQDLQKKENTLAGYFGNDDFALLTQYEENKMERLYQDLVSLIKAHSDKVNVFPAVGIYEVTQKGKRVFSLYDRAKLACTSVKGNYTVRVKKFHKEMLEEMESEYLLYTDIQRALKNKEFSFYLQPKCNIKNGKIVGAEALVRWHNPEKGMISPGVFIPFLEKIGFIAELDAYIWEEVCKWQRSMLDKDIQVPPVSVNVSRMDMYSLDVPAYFSDLIRKYDLSPKMLEVEITEGAYAQDDHFVHQVVLSLRKNGFRVLMDDFGKAYSSLNMLSEIAVDVIKIDMRFLNFDKENKEKGIDLIESIYNMAHVMGVSVVVEGIETKEQKEFLKEMGCTYGQGFYFYRPLPVQEFEKALANNEKISEEDLYEEKNERFQLRELMTRNVLSERMLNKLLGAVAFYDIYEDQITVMRYNEQYAAIVGNKTFSSDTKLYFAKHLYEEDRSKIFQMFAKAKENRDAGAFCDLRRRRADNTDMWLHMRAFFLYEREGHAIYYSTLNDVTEVHKNNQTLRFLNNDMPGGYYRHENNSDCDFTYISQRFLDIFGFTRAEIKEQFDDKFINMIHPEDREFAHQCIENLGQTGGNYAQPYRMRSKSGYIQITDLSRLVKYDETEFFQGIILCDDDYYRQMRAAVSGDQDTTSLMPCGIFQAEADGNHEFSYISNSMLAMLGYSRQAFKEKFRNTTENMVWKEDRVRVDTETWQQLQRRPYVSSEFRIELADGSLKWVYSRGRMTTDANGKRWFYTCIMDYDYLKEKYREKEWQQVKYKTLAEIPGMLVYDYSPELDRLTVELSTKDRKMEEIVIEKFVEEMETHVAIAPECMQEQKHVIQTALQYPTSGMTEFRGRFIKGAEYQWYRFRYTSIADENGKIYRIVGRADNVEKEMQTLSDLKKRAMKDSLTGLLNNEAAKKKVVTEMRKNAGGTMFLLDVDDFKAINDTLGHVKGDRLLQRIADVMNAVFRSKDVLARLGGDEFFAFMPGTFDKEQTAAKAEEFLKKVRNISLSDNMKVHCSIGITVTREPTMEVDKVIHQADMALYQSKRDGKDRYEFFEG